MCVYPQHWGFPALTEPSASPAAGLGIFEVRRGENPVAWSSLALFPSEYLGLEGRGWGLMQIVFFFPTYPQSLNKLYFFVASSDKVTYVQSL